eukprot:GHVH01009928.1.p1 GENE.GHVH01009928.1~~GHVH01009928.1.p1  ORF type:complete len:270 (-),score=42.46 GHVH01009928.1:910-1665(-)
MTSATFGEATKDAAVHGRNGSQLKDVEIYHSSYPETTYVQTLDCEISIDSLLSTLTLMTGSPSSSMVVSSRRKDGIGGRSVLNSLQRPLHSFDPRVHCLDIVDSDPTSIPNLLLHNHSVPKFRLSEEEYESRPNNLRKLMKERRDQMARKESLKVYTTEGVSEDEGPRPQIGMRCEIVGGRRGVVKYVGARPSAHPDRTYVGIQLDEPQQSNTEGEGVFEVPPGLGFFSALGDVKFGDFPEVDVFASDDEF